VDREPRARHQNGFSLVEVILALALLGTVMIAMSGLFTLGSRQVDSGRKHSEALAAAQDILEEMSVWSFHGLYETFGDDGSAVTLTADTLNNAFAQKWQPYLAESFAPGTYAEITLDSMTQTGSPPVLNSAQCIQVTVTVYWTESLRERKVQLTMLRL
jgi:prepilin-type N-terminal cleavage/methylation domain-containing protein